MSVTLVLSTVRCVATSEQGLDEIFLTYQIDGGQPLRLPEPPGAYHQMGQGASWQVYQAFTFERELIVTLWEADGAIGGNEQLGQASYAPDSLPEETTLTGAGEYVLVARRAEG